MTYDEHDWPSVGRIARVTALITAVVGAFALIFAVVWVASPGLITVGVGILLAVLLDAGARGLGRLASWSRHVRLGIVFVIAAAVLVGALWYGGTILVSQLNSFLAAMDDLFRQAMDLLQQAGLTHESGDPNAAAILPSTSTLFGSVTMIVRSAVGFVSMCAAIMFLGAFFSWEPQIYKAIVLSVLPQDKRPRVDEVLDQAGGAMREWLIGQSVSMIVIFIFTLLALLLVGMPYPILLAVQAGLLTFIPTLGPFVAGVVIILAGLSQSATMALYGLGTYLLIQFLETHFVTPLVQERTVRFPPAATLGLQVVSAFLFGLLGVAFVVPLAAAGKVLIGELYVNDRLGGPYEVEHEPSWLERWFKRTKHRVEDRL